MGKQVVVAVAALALGATAGCGVDSTPGTRTVQVSSAVISEGSASAAATHQVVYRVEIVQGKPDLDVIGWGYNDPTTGQHESLTPSTAPLPWSKSFTATVDNSQLSISINNDSDASLSCTILVDGQQAATSIAKPHNSDPRGGICTG